MHIETDVQIVNKMFYLVNLALICGTIMTTFLLNAMSVNATLRTALSKVIVVDEHRDLWSRMRFLYRDDHRCYELWVTWTETGTYEKCWSPKSFLYFKALLLHSFYSVLLANVLQGMFKIPCQQNTYSFFVSIFSTLPVSLLCTYNYIGDNFKITT